MKSPTPDPNLDTVPPSTEFHTTHWSVVLAAGDSASPHAEEALEKLCRTYWFPLYAHVRRNGHGPEDAQDLTQAFFARFLERKQVKLAQAERGKFRSFLLCSLKNFLANEWRRAQAEKRGGSRTLLSLEEQREAETRFLADPIDPSASPDLAFEKQWALAMLDHVLSRLRAEFIASGQEHFDALKVFVWGEQSAVSQVEVAARLGMTPNALGVAVHRLRRRYGELLREAIADTVASEDEVDAELRHLIAVISS